MERGIMSNIQSQASPDNHLVYGYAGKLLRVDLSKGEYSNEILDEATLKKYVGGAALGIKFLYDEVNPSTEWSDPVNRLFFGSGPLSGTRVGGTGGICLVTKGVLTNGVASSQANGFFGAFLRFCGFDAMIVQGAAPEWVYLHIHNGGVEFRDASHLVGKNTYEVDHLIKEDLHKKDRQISVLSIGPAGENLVKFACVFADLGHIAGHNGIGAVMGSKKLKAIAVDRGKNSIPLKDKEALSEQAQKILANVLAQPFGSDFFEEGTIGGVIPLTHIGWVPVKNYTTNVHVIAPEKLSQYSAQNIRTKFEAKPSPCWACRAKHCHVLKMTEGKYAGRIFEEPEYEGMAACSSLIGVDDATTSVLLTSEIDRLGLEINETGWVIAFVMECYQKGILSKKDLDGLEMTWGNGEAVMALLNKIAHRQGFGNVLAEGVMRAAKQVGGEAPNLAIHTLKGNTPRGHDHRVMWHEMFDTCVSNLGTLENFGTTPLKIFGLPEDYDTFDPEMVSTREARIKGSMVFEDSLVTCNWNTNNQVDLLCDAVNAATGWDINLDAAIVIGKRAVNLARAFNLRAGIGAELDAPSARYGSTLTDGPSAGKGVMPHWDKMLRNYYTLMGWDANTGTPLPQTLKDLGLDFVIPQLY
jgi:aldehyde:ferredoxin oxidoreductase